MIKRCSTIRNRAVSRGSVLTTLLFICACALADMSQGIRAFNAGDYASAAIEFTIDARKGNTQAAVNLGLMYENGLGVARDLAEAFKWYESAALEGNVLAQLNLAALYYEGSGTQQNFAVAAHWYQQAAMQGNATAQYNLAVMYETGQGVELDLVQAWAWLKLAANTDTIVSDEEQVLLTEKLTADEVLSARALFEHYLTKYAHTL